MRSEGLKNVMARAHGGLTSAGKVRKATPKKEKKVKPKLPRGRAYKRMQYNKYFCSDVLIVDGRTLNPNNLLVRQKRGF